MILRAISIALALTTLTACGGGGSGSGPSGEYGLMVNGQWEKVFKFQGGQRVMITLPGMGEREGTYEYDELNNMLFVTRSDDRALLAGSKIDEEGCFALYDRGRACPKP
jgi:hypothetical protein